MRAAPCHWARHWVRSRDILAARAHVRSWRGPRVWGSPAAPRAHTLPVLEERSHGDRARPSWRGFLRTGPVTRLARRSSPCGSASHAGRDLAESPFRGRRSHIPECEKELGLAAAPCLAQCTRTVRAVVETRALGPEPRCPGPNLAGSRPPVRSRTDGSVLSPLTRGVGRWLIDSRAPPRAELGTRCGLLTVSMATAFALLWLSLRPGGLRAGPP